MSDLKMVVITGFNRRKAEKAIAAVVARAGGKPAAAVKRELVAALRGAASTRVWTVHDGGDADKRMAA